jgi:hypothetical protein
VLAVQFAQTREAAVDQPQLAVGSIVQLVDADVAGDMGAPRQERATAGRLRSSFSDRLVPMAKRLARAARPIGRGKTRRWVLSTSPSAPITTGVLIDAHCRWKAKATRQHA